MECSGRRARRPLAWAGVLGACLIGAVGARAAGGDLAQPAGDAGCVSSAGATGCAGGRALDGARVSAAAPDGRNLYVAAFENDAVSVFDRDPSGGAISQRPGSEGCSSESAAEGCAAGRGLDGASTVAVSPDGENVYVAAETSDAVAIFDRAPATGALTQKAGAAGCVSATGASGCAAGRALDGARFVAVSPDGKNVYVAAQDARAIAVFVRSRSDGTLVQKGGTDACFTNDGSGGCTDGAVPYRPVSIAVSPDGADLYAAAEGIDGDARTPGGVAVFSRDTSTGALAQRPAGAGGCVADNGSDGCVDGRALSGATSLTLSPSGAELYVASYFSDSLTTFDRDAATGLLSQRPDAAGCVSESGADGCGQLGGIDGVHGVGVSPDGLSLYTAAKFSNQLSVFDRDPGGALTRRPGPAGCFSSSASGCTAGRAIRGAHLPTLSADGADLYLTSFDDGAVAVFDRTGATAPPAGPPSPGEPPGSPARPAPKPRCLGAVATVTGTPGSEVLLGTPGADVIVAGAGDDRVRAFGGPDRVCAGPGDDRILAGGGRDLVLAAAGRDVLLGSSGADRLYGGPGPDLVRSGAGPDLGAGGAGRDNIYGNRGRDLLRGGSGFDRLIGGSGGDRCRPGAQGAARRSCER